MLMSRIALEKIGLLDSSLFAYHEDVDWCYRGRKLGFKCIYVPYPEVWHKGGATSKKEGRMSPMHRYLGTRNKLAVIKKNFGMMKFVEVLTREIFLVTPLYMALYTLRGHFDLISAHFEGIKDALKDRNKFYE
jgi:GT2 family glycosyltransferase